MRPRCDLCMGHGIAKPAPFYRLIGRAYVHVCVWHERTRRRLLSYPKRPRIRILH